MTDFLKLILPVLLSPTNYTDVLKKLASFLFYEVWLVTFLLRDIPTINAWFRSIETYGALGAAISIIPNNDKLNIFGIVIALIIAGASYAIQLHNRISDVFGIRERFDRNHILLPLAVLVGAKLSPAKLNAIVTNRESLLRVVFYPFVSSTATAPLVDKHEIQRALEGWSWFWIFIEAIPLVLIAAATAWYFGAHFLLAGFSVAFFILWILAWLYSLRLAKLTRPEVEAIAANPAAAVTVREAFDALQN